MSGFKKIMRLILIVSILVAAGASSLRYVQEMRKEKMVTITVWEQEKSILHLPLYVALQEGYFDEQKIRVQIKGPGDAPETNPYKEQVSDLILADPVEQLYHLAIRHSSPNIIMALAQRDYTFLLGREKDEQKAFAWENLNGKRIICYPPETGPGMAMENALRERELLPQHQVTLYNRIPLDLHLGTFKAGSGSYIQLPGLDALLAQKSEVGFIVARPGDTTMDFPAVLCAAWPATMEQKPAAVQAFINGLYKAQLWLQQEPELANAAIKNHLAHLTTSSGVKVDLKITHSLVQKYNDLDMWAPSPALKKSDFTNYVQSLITAGQLPSLVIFEEAVDNSLAQVATQAVKYIPKEERKNWLQKLFDTK